MTDDLPSDAQSLADQVATAFVHRLFPSLRSPAFLACPDDECAVICRTAITAAAKKKRVKTEFIDLRPNPAARLNQITARLRDIQRPHDRRQAPVADAADPGWIRLAGRQQT